MFRISHVTGLVYLTLCLTGCGSDSDIPGGGSTPPPPTPNDNSTELEELKVLLGDAIDNASVCKNKDDTCDWALSKFMPATPLADSLGKRVLILDSGMESASLTRYSSRVVAHYDFNDSGYLSETSPEMELPVELISLFDDIKNFSEFIPASVLQDLQAKYLEKFTIYGTPGHGESIFTFLAESSPESQFVLAEYRYLDVWNASDSWCMQIEADNEAAMQHIQKQYDDFYASIADIVQLHHISFINASWGFTPQTIRDSYAYVCGAEPDSVVVQDIINIEHAFLSKLANLDNQSEALGIRNEVVLVQAGVAANQELIEGDPNYPTDCDSSMAHRLRVADYDNFKAEVSAAGSNDTSLLSANEKNGLACNDYYVTLGYGTLPAPMREERERSFKATLYGFGWIQHAFPPTPSFAAPVALSQLIHLDQQQSSILSAEDLLQLLTRNGESIIADPIQHQNFEAIRLEYPFP